MNISTFAIKGLFGTKSVNIPISNNRLVLVGVNGVGKSTVLSMFYAFISLRWDRLREFQFDVIEMVLNDSALRLRKEDVVRFRRLTRSLGQYPGLGPRRSTTDDDLHDTLENVLKGKDLSPDTLAQYNMPLSTVRRLRDEILHSTEYPALFSLDNYFEAPKR